jgi:uncharacterized protein YgbK (DUF1537 family)
MTETAAKLPEGLLVSWYGDDFTGSAATMEALTFAGLPAVLFLGVPDEAMLARFADYRGIGIAGVARSKGTEWMRLELPPVFDLLAGLHAPISHYKICSTLDSAPEVGSIGCAVDLAIPVLGGAWHPLVAAAPAIGRYQAFGNLFAVSGGSIHRLDRHPTMSRHPVTPMDEADVRAHLARQTQRKIGLVDLTSLNDPAAAHRALEAQRSAGAEIVALDVLDEDSLAAVGGLIWSNRGERLFAIGSQGLEYALIAYWQQAGLIAAAPTAGGAGAVDRIAVVSGSCSPDTAAQIAWAEKHGFEPVRVEARLAADAAAWAGETARVERQALALIDQGRDPIIFTASGPDDPAIGELNDAAEVSGTARETLNERLGTGLGEVLGRVLDRAGLKRGIIAGGDTSGYGAMALGIEALTALAPTVPGAALFKAHRREPACGDMEVALKGGQMGSPDYFQWIKMGGGPSLNRSI